MKGKKVSWLLVFLFFCFFFTSTSHASSFSKFQPRSVAFNMSLQGERHAAGTGFRGNFIFQYNFWKWLGLDAVGYSGMIWGDDSKEHPPSLYIALAVGLYYVSGNALERWNWRVGARLNHVHLATLKSWQETFAANLLGDSDGGVVHRSGFEVHVSVDSPAQFRLGMSVFRWNLSLSASMLPNSELAFWSVRFGVGFRFQLIKRR